MFRVSHTTSLSAATTRDYFSYRRTIAERRIRYLIRIGWFNQWKRYVGFDIWDKSNAGEDVIKPGPIDNIGLLDQGRLRRHLVDWIDYNLLPIEAWNKLLSWYGISRNSVGIKRQVIEFKQCIMEVYPLELKACLYHNESNYKVVTISRYDTILTLDKVIRGIFNIGLHKHTRLFNRRLTYKFEHIEDVNLSVQDVGLFDGQRVLIEVQNLDGTWPTDLAYKIKLLDIITYFTHFIQLIIIYNVSIIGCKFRDCWPP